MSEPFLEMQALAAALNEDEDELEAVLRQLLPGELSNLGGAAVTLSEEAFRMARQLRRRVPQGDTDD